MTLDEAIDFVELYSGLQRGTIESQYKWVANCLIDFSESKKMKFIKSELKSLSEITDEDIIEVGKIIGWNITETIPLFIVKQKVGTFLSIGLDDKGFSYHPQESFKAYQYLQSKNYKLPKYF